MALSLSITDDMVMTALRAFLVSCVASTVEIFQSQMNRVPQPSGSDFIVMTPTMRTRMSTNTNDWNKLAAAAVSIDRSHSSNITIQLDVYGPNATDNALIITTLFRDAYACDMMQPTGIQPLYVTDGMQGPFVDGEQQYENRWTMKATLGGSPIVSTPQDFAATLAATLKPVN